MLFFHFYYISPNLVVMLRLWIIPENTLHPLYSTWRLQPSTNLSLQNAAAIYEIETTFQRLYPHVFVVKLSNEINGNTGLPMCVCMKSAVGGYCGFPTHSHKGTSHGLTYSRIYAHTHAHSATHFQVIPKVDQVDWNGLQSFKDKLINGEFQPTK